MLDDPRDQTEICLTCKRNYPPGTDRCPSDGDKLYSEKVCKLVGSTFAERYEILAPVGEGGMSVVYKARHVHMQRTVAIKLLRERIASDEKAVLRFKREAQATGNLSHHNIIAVYDFGITAEHQAFFVMDYLEGDGLEYVIEKEGRLDPSRAVGIFKQICDGLEHAHKKGVVHRDMKPSNIILVHQDDGSELVKIVDFGIAKMVAVDASTKQQLTQTGQIFGSPLYLSPEQCEGLSMDARSDIYSLGCLMYEVLSGKPPLMGDTALSTMMKHMNEAPPPFASVLSEDEIPKPIEYVVRKCLEKAPQDRYQSVMELRQSLLDAAAASSLQGYRTGGVIEVSKKQSELASTWDKLVASMPGLHNARARRRRWVLLLALGLPAVALLGLIAFSLFWQGPSDDRGTLWSKMRWVMSVSSAEQALAAREYPAALKELDRAQRLATTFGDSNNRLFKTLKLKSQVLGAASMYEQQEQVNNEILRLQQQHLLSEVEEIRSLLTRLGQTTTSAVSLEKSRLEAEANSEKIILASRGLDSLGLIEENTAFLKQAIDTYDQLGLQHSRTVSTLMTLLAECLIRQEEHTQVRPLFVSALEIRKALPNQKSPETKRLVLRSLLKLGQFDRDRSNFTQAKPELMEALKMARAEFPSDSDLEKECLQSYSDLLRQMGDIEGAKRVRQEAKNLSRRERIAE